ncbi:hypothetical protein PINS_up005542 [Pythium insidiosum]|nr:hypothetical protein PINS_up005542 [Pythium insidiosum]
MGATQTIMGEPLAAAHFLLPPQQALQGSSADTGSQEIVVAYVNLYEVLFALVLDGVALPASIVEYYCVNTCTLLVSLFGYPGQKLEGWKSRVTSLRRDKDRWNDRLDQILSTCSARIRKDLRFETHLQFVLHGVVPANSYPLDVLARLSAFQVIDPTTDLYSVAGYALFYRMALVVAKTRPELVTLWSQWLLEDDTLGLAWQTAEIAGARVHVFPWFHATHALHGAYPDNHTLIVLHVPSTGLHLFYWLRHDDIKTFQAFRLTPTELLSTGDLDELVAFVDARLKPHVDATSAVSHVPLTSYCLVVDRLRHTLLGSSPQALFTPSSVGSRQLPKSAWLKLLALLVHRLPSVASVVMAPIKSKTSRWIPPVTLQSSDPDAVFLSPVRPEDKGGDLSSDADAQIFPPVAYQLQREAERPQRHVHSHYERHQLGNLSVWLLVESYEAFDRVALWTDEIDDATAALDKEMDRLLLMAPTTGNK